MEFAPPCPRRPSLARRLAGLAILMTASIGLLAGCSEFHPDEGPHIPPGHAR